MKTNDNMPTGVALIAEILNEWRNALPETRQRVMDYLCAADTERREREARS